MLIVFPDADHHLPDDIITPLKQYGDFQTFIGRPETNNEYIKRVRNADGILLGWSIPNEVIAECPNLKIISFTGIGASNFVNLKYAESRGIIVTNTPGYADNAVAEHALSLVLSLAKNLNHNQTTLARGNWDQSRKSIELKGKTIGLIGLGGIGQRMAEFCKAIGMNVICWTFNPDPVRAQKIGLSFTSLEDLLEKSDFISLHLPYTDQTKKMLGKKELSLMKKEAFLINTSRAELIETDALVELLSSRRIAGAGIDVFDEEPISKQNPLLTLDNVILSPHIAFNTPEANIEILRISINNLVEFFKGDIRNSVNF